MPRHDEICQVQHAASACLLLCWKLAGGTPDALIVPVAFTLEEVAHDSMDSAVGPDDDADVLPGMTRSRDYIDLVIDLEWLAASEVMDGIQVFLANIMREDQGGAREQVDVAHMIRVSVGADNEINVARRQALLSQPDRNLLLVPRASGINDDGLRTLDQRDAAVGALLHWANPARVADLQNDYFILGHSRPHHEEHWPYVVLVVPDERRRGGDFRDWAEIKGWAAEIAAALHPARGTPEARPGSGSGSSPAGGWSLRS